MDITTDTFVDTNEGGPSEFYYPNELQPGSSEWSDATFHADTVTDLPVLAMDDGDLRQFIEGQANSNTKRKPVQIWMLGNAFLNAFLSLGPWNVFLLESSTVYWPIFTFPQGSKMERSMNLTPWLHFSEALQGTRYQYNRHIVDMHMHTHSTLFLPIQVVFEGQILSTRHYSQWFISHVSTSTHCKAQRALEEGKGSEKKCSWSSGEPWWRLTVWSWPVWWPWSHGIT